MIIVSNGIFEIPEYCRFDALWDWKENRFDGGGDRNSPIQSGNSQWQHPGCEPANGICITVQFKNKAHLKLFKERCKATPQRIFGWNNFCASDSIKFWIFFICSFKIMCKPMVNFAENLNLGKRVLPPWVWCHSAYILSLFQPDNASKLWYIDLWYGRNKKFWGERENERQYKRKRKEGGRKRESCESWSLWNYHTVERGR